LKACSSTGTTTFFFASTPYAIFLSATTAWNRLDEAAVSSSLLSSIISISTSAIVLVLNLSTSVAFEDVPFEVVDIEAVAFEAVAFDDVAFAAVEFEAVALEAVAFEAYIGTNTMVLAAATTASFRTILNNWLALLPFSLSLTYALM
jgi:hypothetical protein